MTRRKLLVTGPAQDDLADIHSFTRDRYGPEMAAAYDGLIKRALQDLIDDPFRLGGKARPDIGAGIHSYHISLSRGRASSRIKSPWYFVL